MNEEKNIKIVYDIEVFHQMNMAGFLTNTGKKFWIVNATGYPKEQEWEYDGGIIYVNHPRAKKFVNAVLKKQLWGVPYGFNNHNYDDFLIFDIASTLDPEFVKGKSDTIITKLPKTFFEWESYDTREQMPVGFSLKKWESMAGLMVDESSIPFDYEGSFTKEQILEVIEYNQFDLEATLALANERKNYFDGKNLLVQEYGYPGARRYSNGSVSARYLMGNDRLEEFRPNVPKITGVPKDAESFLQSALVNSPWVSLGRTEAIRTKRMKEITEPVNLLTEEFGNVISWGWGGLHSARGELTLTKTGKQRKKYFHETFEDVEQWDVASMFPNIIIRDNLLGQATPKFKKLVIERLKNKKAGNPLSATQKIVVNAVYGLLRLQSSRLFNPHSAIHVNVAGMVAIYNLAKRLAPYGTIIQINTDGIAFKPDENVPHETFVGLREAWEEEFGLELEVSRFAKLIQRDVNNYLAVYDNGKIKAKGGSVNRAEKNDLTKNTSPAIVQQALVANLIYGTPVEETITKGTNPLDYAFTLSAMKGATQTGFTIEFPEQGLPTRLPNHVNRVIATKYGSQFMKEKTPDPKTGELRPAAMFPDAPEHATLVNQALDQSFDDTSLLDFDYYVNLTQKKLDQWR